MKNRIFLDTNIIIDFLITERKNHLIALKLFAKFDNYDIFISEDMLTTIFYIDKNNQKVLSFFKNIVIKKWHIATFGEKTIKKAIDLSFNKKLDLEDTLQCFCAKENNCEFLITNDNQFYDCGINVCTANDFLKKQTKK